MSNTKVETFQFEVRWLCWRAKIKGKELMLSILRSKAEDSASMLAEVWSPRIEPSEFEPTTAQTESSKFNLTIPKGEETMEELMEGEKIDLQALRCS